MSAPGAIATKVPQKTNTWRHQGTVPFLLRNHLQAPDFFGTGIDGSKTWKEAVTFIDLSRENSEVDFECASKKMKIIFKKKGTTGALLGHKNMERNHQSLVIC